jgi:hypothetical protein
LTTSIATKRKLGREGTKWSESGAVGTEEEESFSGFEACAGTVSESELWVQRRSRVFLDLRLVETVSRWEDSRS